MARVALTLINVDVAHCSYEEISKTKKSLSLLSDMDHLFHVVHIINGETWKVLIIKDI